MEALTAQNKRVAEARVFAKEDKGFSFMRRTLAFLGVFAIVVVPLIGAAVYPDMPITYGFQESAKGFLFSDPTSVMQFTTARGITILPFHEHFISAIVGLYFGRMGNK